MSALWLSHQFSDFHIDVIDEYLERLHIVRRRVVFAQKVDNVQDNFDAIATPKLV
jgi:hypothetical protein